MRLRTLPEAGAAQQTPPLEIAGQARVTMAMSALLGPARGAIEVVEEGSSTGALVVEGAIYWSVGGQPFGAGANWPATRIP